MDIQEFTAYKQIPPKKITLDTNSYLILEDDKSSPSYNTKNIIAKNKNFDNNKKTIYLTAHYDSEEKTSGVIDNSTGVSVVLEVSRILQLHQGDINIVPIFFGAEELGLVGSRYFVDHLNDIELSNTIGCINIDMVGIKDSDGLRMWSYDLKNKKNVENLEVNDNVLTHMINNKTPYNLKNVLGAGTDAIAFYGAKIPAITLTNKLSNSSIAYETRDKQLSALNIDELILLCKNLSIFLSEFDLKEYNQIK
ncbi:MAG: M28 family metallopeptidase [Peptostreptococcaceae bacterium]